VPIRKNRVVAIKLWGNKLESERMGRDVWCVCAGGRESLIFSGSSALAVAVKTSSRNPNIQK
jgi:hypothetical protein